jgi:hypothetical protein
VRLRPVPEFEFFFEFAVAEVRNDRRHDRRYSEALSPELFARLEAGRHRGLSAMDRAAIREAVLRTRPEYLEPLMGLGLTWQKGSLPSRDLPGLRPPRLHMFRPYSPSRSLPEFARALAARRALPRRDLGPLRANYRRMRRDFDLRRLRGRPILVGASARGPFTIVEGMTRLSVLCSKYLEGEPVPARVPVLVGTGARAVRWPFY